MQQLFPRWVPAETRQPINMTKQLPPMRRIVPNNWRPRCVQADQDNDLFDRLGDKINKPYLQDIANDPDAATYDSSQP